MSSKILTWVVILIIVIAASALGYWSAAKKNISAGEQVFLNLTKSKIVQSWTATAYGKITAISGKTVTLSSQNQSENLSILIKDSAKIELVNFLEPPQSGVVAKTSTQQIQFSDLKVGQNASIAMQVINNGAVSGISIVIFSEIP